MTDTTAPDGSAAGDTDECTLCGLPVEDPPTAADVEADVEGPFCCRGCLEVARTLDAAGGDVAASADRATDVLDAGPDQADVDGDAETAYLAVEGMHCATCETFLEARATDRAGVLAAAASYPADAVKVTYDPAVVDRESLPEAVSGTGYEASLDGDTDPSGSTDGAEDDGTVARLLVGGIFGMLAMVQYVLFLYLAYAGVPADLLLVDVHSSAGQYVLWEVWAFAGVVLGYTGWPLLRGAAVSLRAGRPNMDLLVSLAAVNAYAYSTLALLAGRVELYFDVTIVVVLAVTVGTYYERRIKRRAAGRLTDLTVERTDDARRRTTDGTETVPVDALEPDDEVVVATGERVPVDGTVLEGTAAVDEALVTGESTPVRREPGDEVVGGGLVAEGRLVVDADATSTLDRLTALLWTVRSARPGVQRFADRLAAVFVPLVLLVAALAVGAHLLVGARPADALLTGLAVLVVSCPCALGLATPLAIAAGVRSALAEGAVVTSGAAFERADDADVLVLDKTGTLTTGEFRVVETPNEDLLRRAAALERYADHPLSGAIADAAPSPVPDAESYEAYPGQGVGGRVAGDETLVGRVALFEDEGWRVPDDCRDRYDRARERGLQPVLVGRDGTARGVVVAADRPRPGWKPALHALGRAVDRVVLLSGDDRAAVERFAAHPAVNEALAGVPPAAKAETVTGFRENGTVVMVGDGSNDAAALAAADLGIALGSGTELAADAADAVVVSEDLRTVPRTLAVLRATRRRVRENVGWALLYNAVAVPAAALGVVSPLVAAVAMAGSSLLVVSNSVRSLGSDAEGVPPSSTTEDGGSDSGPDSSGTGVDAPTVAEESATQPT